LSHQQQLPFQILLISVSGGLQPITSPGLIQQLALEFLIVPQSYLNQRKLPFLQLVWRQPFKSLLEWAVKHVLVRIESLKARDENLQTFFNGLNLCVKTHNLDIHLQLKSPKVSLFTLLTQSALATLTYFKLAQLLLFQFFKPLLIL
jgi:hypothetical protein